MNRPAVLFVCLGNICRSPLAEAALREAANNKGLKVEVDSAGTGGWHVGDPPDPRAQETALAAGVDIGDLRARQLSQNDFDRFTHLIAMDRQNLKTIKSMQPKNSRKHIGLLLDYVTGREGEEVADPYYGSKGGFAATWADVTAGADGIVRSFLSN